MSARAQAWSADADRARHAWWIALAWLAIGLISATQVVVGLAALGRQHRWALLFFTTAAAWLLWAALTPVILALSRRFPIVRPGGWKHVPLHLAAALAISVGRIACSAFLEWAINPLEFAPAQATYRAMFFTMLYMQFHTGFIIYGATVAIDSIIDSIRRLARREAEAARLAGELAKAQLDALRRQLEPHFLFNTLNGISGLVREKRNDDAVAMIAGLSDLLRRVLEDSGRQLVPLAEEMSFLESYIDLQSMRFGDRLKVSVDVPLELYGALVPPLVLQPLVENAIVHGIGKREEGGEIRLTAREADGLLAIRLYNDGPALSITGDRAGVGLPNTRGRLVTLFGAESRVELRNIFRDSGNGVETIIHIPYRTAL